MTPSSWPTVWCASLAFAACGSVEPFEKGEQDPNSDVRLPSLGVAQANTGSVNPLEDSSSLPQSADSSLRDIPSPDIVGAVGDALTRPMRALERLLDPDSLIPTVERSLSRSIVRAARRQYARELEAGAREPELLEGRVESPFEEGFSSDLSLPRWDFSTTSFEGELPSFSGSDFLPLPSADLSNNPLRFEIRPPSLKHFQSALRSEGDWGEVVDRLQYRVSLDLNLQGDSLSILVGEDAVGFVVTMPIRCRRSGKKNY